MAQTWQKTLRITQINAENLFLFIDQQPLMDVRELSEKQWQRLSTASQPNKSLSKTLRLAESLLDISPDFILVNEVGGLESLSNFNRYFLNDLYEPFLVEGNSDRGIDVGYLVKRSLPVKCELNSHKDRPLNFLYPHDIESNKFHSKENPEKVIRSHYFSRDCSELRVTRRGESAPALIFLLVHLKSKLDPYMIDPEGRERRGAELKTLLEIYREVRGKWHGVPVIVGGDFNGNARREKTGPELSSILETDLLNTLEVFNLPMEKAATQIQFSRTGSSTLLQIDYLFISPELKDFLLEDFTGVYRYKSDLKIELPLPQNLEQRLHLPSDHYPVVATFKNFLISSP